MRQSISFSLDFKRNPYPGKLIVIEGIDGSGKTTQTKMLVDRLKGLGKEVFLTKEPTDGIVGQLIKRIINKEIRVPKTSIQYLFCADRVIHLEEVIIPKLKEGMFVVSDRYFWSAVAYGLADINGLQDASRLLVAQSILSFYNRFLLPDFTFYLRVSAQTASARLVKLKKERELYEREETLKKIVSGYEWLVDKFPKEITIIDGEKPVEEVTKKILSNL